MPTPPMPTPPTPSHDDIVRELLALPQNVRPLRFNNLVTGSQYLPIYRLAGALIEPGMMALDWGCGSGHFSYFLLRQGLTVKGFSIEASGHGLTDHLKRRFPEHYEMVAGDPEKPVALPFPDQSFDLVCSIGVLEHVRETGGSEQASLDEITRILRPGGHFLCGMLPKKYSWIEFMNRTARPNLYAHPFRYTRQDIQDLIHGAGLELSNVQTHGFLPRNSWNNRRLKPMGCKAVVNRSFNAIDRALAQCARPIAQNFMFAARRPA